MSRRKVVVAMSGGVDSSVAACLLHEQGYEVVGFFMRTGATLNSSDSQNRHQGCCSASDAADARFVAGKLGIHFYALNFQPQFDRLIDYFVDEYTRGRTPNPCVMCNNGLKFGSLIDYARTIGADLIATGHYARIVRRQGRAVLRRGVDQKKDQSYVLFGLRRDILDRVLFPLGQLTKAQVRTEARRLDLPVWEKPDSTEICFVPDRDYARLVKERRPEAFRQGKVLDEEGNVLGEHAGVVHYTIGQRRGLGIALGQPAYVTHLDAASNTVTLGERTSLLERGLIAERVNWLVDPPTAPIRTAAQIRYHHQAAPATVEPADNGSVRVVFDEPQAAITPGQAVAFYDGDDCLGGGWINTVVRDS